MTTYKARQHSKKAPFSMSTLATADASPVSLYEVGKGKTPRAEHSTQSPKQVTTPDSTPISTPITSSHITSEERSARIAATLFKSTVLALLTAGLLKRGRDEHGNITLVLPCQQWNDEMRLI